MRSAVFACLVASSYALEALSVEGNPHAAESGSDTTCCPAQRLPPESLLPAPTALSTQADTFVRTRQRKHHDVTVEVFTFRQPARLSNRVLPFDLALVAHIDPTGIAEVPTPPQQAADSWFPDYAWSAYIVCTSTGAGAPQHLGWRFTRKPESAAAAGPDSFVALIVNGREAEAEAEAAARMRVPLNVAPTVREEDEEDAAAEAAEAAEAAALPVGVEAPGWMVAMVAAVSARAAPRSS